MIELIHERMNEDDKTAFFKITLDSEVYEWHGDYNKDADPKAYFETMEDKLHFLILQKMYPDADWQRFKTDENTELEAMQEWIADGCRNQIVVGYYKNGNPIYKYIIIEKQPWKSTHPPELKLTDKIDSLTVNADLKSLLRDIIMR